MAVSNIRGTTPLQAGSPEQTVLDVFSLTQQAAHLGARLALEEFQKSRKAQQDRGSGDETFGKALRSTREASGLTQEQFASRAGVHYTTIGKIETGDRGMTAETLAKVLWAGGRMLQDWAIRYFATGQTDD